MNEVVVTGVGAITPSGLSAAALWDAVVRGESAITALPEPVAGVSVGGVVRGFVPPEASFGTVRTARGGSTEAPSGGMRHLSPVQLWAIAAADEAMPPESPAPPWDPRRVAIVVATGSGPVDMLQHATRALDAHGPRRVPPALSAFGTSDAVAAALSRRYGTRGATHAVSAACASGAVGIGEGLRRIRHGYADAVLVVGMEDCLGPLHLAAGANLRALAPGDPANPAAASRPFDRGRTGYVMSQGAAAVLLESAASASARGARVLGRVAGYGESSDAHHATAPDPEGAGAAEAMRACLADAGVAAREVDHVNTHGTGTVLGDAAEIAALGAVLGARREAVPLTATKSSTGHLLGAAGVAEAILAVQTMREGLIPPTLNLDDPAFDGWDIVRGAARPHRSEHVLSTSFGFGGHNAALLLARA
ncbi:beta-ketoacyl-[acyl-carrier-protein] synthase family protein [Microbacterium sp. No. 7]|uniref:beta-ketoacyl-[acyl-carrier-protein] synthase family protein n=1 Tax=Microbacterium sp. No. 7 TaxID=1714373 RepID=UPI0006D224E3|nr:beta-ketoacyl-[acyl-carrier-protein] synthase family protein [Microbacterium sp. No. 7]ALJ18654.1 3-oxoacyl-ACP synthase [Microbacterium sp. No. 7]